MKRRFRGRPRRRSSFNSRRRGRGKSLRNYFIARGGIRL